MILNELTYGNTVTTWKGLLVVINLQRIIIWICILPLALWCFIENFSSLFSCTAATFLLKVNRLELFLWTSTLELNSIDEYVFHWPIIFLSFLFLDNQYFKTRVLQYVSSQLSWKVGADRFCFLSLCLWYIWGTLHAWMYVKLIYWV